MYGEVLDESNTSGVDVTESEEPSEVNTTQGDKQIEPQSQPEKIDVGPIIDEMQELSVLDRRPPSKWGNTFVLFSRRNHAVITIGPNWPYWVLMEFLILIGCVVIFFVLFLVSIYVFYLGLVILVAQLGLAISLALYAPKHPDLNISSRHFDLVTHYPEMWCSQCKIVKIGTVTH